MTRIVRALLLSLLAALALAVAGCGGSEAGGSGAVGTQGLAGAELLPADTVVYAAIDSDLDSDQWQQVDELLQKFPGRERLISEIREGLSSEGVSYDDDIEPALGEALYFALLDIPGQGASEEDAPFVFLHKPKDADRFEALLRKADEDDEVKFRTIDDGWYVVAENEAAIDDALVAEGGETLADDERFTAAMDELADDAVMKLYVNGAPVSAAIRDYGKDAGVDLSSFGYDRFDSLSMAISAETDGMRLAGSVRGDLSGEARGEPFSSKFLPEIPSGALAVLSARGEQQVAEGLRRLRKNELMQGAVEQFERQLGVSIEDLAPLFENEIAFYVRPGSPIPELTLVLESDDEAGDLRTVDRLVAGVSKLADGGPVRQSEVDGVTVKSATFGAFALHYAGFDGRIVVTSGRNAIRDLRSDEDKLSDDPTYKDAAEAADLPDETAGLLYLNFEDGIPLLLDFAQAADTDVPTEVSENLRPLRSFLAFGGAEGESIDFTAFLAVE